MLPEKLQMHNCRKNGLMNKRENTNGMPPTIKMKINSMQTKQLLSLKWDKSWKMNQLLRSSKWWKKCNNTTKCLLKKRETENPNGLLTNKTRMELKLREPTWVILCKRISQQLNQNLLHTDSYHITSRDLEKNKLKTLLLREMNRLLMLNWLKRMQTPKNTNGPFKIYPTLNMYSIMNLIFKIEINKPWVNTVMQT